MVMAQQSESLPKPEPMPSSATLKLLTRDLVSFGLRPTEAATLWVQLPLIAEHLKLLIFIAKSEERLLREEIRTLERDNARLLSIIERSRKLNPKGE